MYWKEYNAIIWEWTYIWIGEKTFLTWRDFHTKIEKKIMLKKWNPDIFQEEHLVTVQTELGFVKVKIWDILVEN